MAPTSTPSTDILIAGAGLGGLSVAARLLADPDGPVVWLVDPRPGWENDRTWCFWARAGDPILDDASFRWDRWAVRSGADHVVRSAPGEVYAHVPAGRVYRRLLDVVEGTGRARLVHGRVDTIREVDGEVEAQVAGGMRRFAAAVDTRPPDLSTAAAAGERRLLQHFVGWHVRAPRPVFDPAVVTLMDFQEGPGVHFVYVLPYSAHEALVEDTWFSAAVHPPPVYAAALTAWLDTHVGAGWSVLREEAGVLPMSTEAFDPHPSPRVWRVGLAGGAARPATGYAFLATRRMAEQVARRVKLGSSAPLPALRDPHTTLMDAVFLEWLHTAPERAPAGFLRMFTEADPGALVRFLSDRSSAADALAVIRALAPVAGSSMVGAAMARFGLAGTSAR